MSLVGRGEYVVPIVEIEDIAVSHGKGFKSGMFRVARLGVTAPEKWREDPYAVDFIGGLNDRADRMGGIVTAGSTV